MEDFIKLIGGHVEVEVLRDGPNGPEVISRTENHNLVVTQGKKRLVRMMQGNVTKMFRFFRLGSNSAAAGSADTNVKTAIAGSIKTVDLKTVSSGRTYKWVISYPSGVGSLSAAAIKECVLLDAKTSPGGSCLMRTVLSTVAKTTTDKLRLTYKFRIG